MSTGPLRVLFVGHTYITKVGQAKLAALSELGVKVGFVAPNNWIPASGLFDGQSIPLERTNESLAIYPAKVFRSGHIASHIYEPGVLLSSMHQFRPDIVQVEEEVYSFTSAQVALNSKLLSKRLVVFGWENLDRPLHFSQLICRFITLSIADAVIAGNSDGAQLVHKWGFHGPVVVMPQLGVDGRQFDRALRIESPLLRIGYVGRMVAEKGGDILLRAFAEITEAHNKARLVFTGSGPDRGNWQYLCGELGIAELVTWVDTVPHEQIPAVLAQLDVLVLPSRTVPWWKEQFGLVLAQAMSMGIPVVGARSGAIPDVIGRDDVLFDEGDHESLARILRQLISSAGRRKSMSEWGYRRAKKRFASEAIARQQLQYLRDFQDDWG